MSSPRSIDHSLLANGPLIDGPFVAVCPYRRSENQRANDVLSLPLCTTDPTIAPATAALTIVLHAFINAVAMMQGALRTAGVI